MELNSSGAALLYIPPLAPPFPPGQPELPLGIGRAAWESSAAWSASKALLQSRSLKLLIGNIAAQLLLAVR